MPVPNVVYAASVQIDGERCSPVTTPGGQVAGGRSWPAQCPTGQAQARSRLQQGPPSQQNGRQSTQGQDRNPEGTGRLLLPRHRRQVDGPAGRNWPTSFQMLLEEPTIEVWLAE